MRTSTGACNGRLSSWKSSILALVRLLQRTSRSTPSIGNGSKTIWIRAMRRGLLQPRRSRCTSWGISPDIHYYKSKHSKFCFVHRYESPIGASPSRNLDHQKPFNEDEMFDRSTSYRGSLGKSLGNAPSYNGKHEICASHGLKPPKSGCRMQPTAQYSFTIQELWTI